MRGKNANIVFFSCCVSRVNSFYWKLVERNKYKLIKTKKRFLGLISLSLIMFMVTLDTTITNIALPNITNYFKSDLTDTNWISTIYVLIMAIAIIPASKFGDQFGRKKLMGIGLITFGVGSTLCGFSNTLPILIVMRFIQGIGGAIVTPIMIPLSVSLFGREEANHAVGIIGAVTAVAAAAGPPIGGIILRYLNWKWIFFVNVPIIIFAFILVNFCFEESFDLTISKKVDFWGLIFLTLCLAQLTFLLVKGYDFGWDSSTSRILMFGIVSSLLIFIWIEQRVKFPLLELSIFKEITFLSSSIIYFICGFVVVCSSLIFNFYLEDVRGYSALNASYIIMFMSITVMIAMPLGSKLATYMGYRNIISIGMLLMAISLFLLAGLMSDTTNKVMIFFMIILGFGFGLTCLSIVSAVQYIPENKAGIASGVVNAARQLGTCLGIALLVGMMSQNVSLAKKNIRINSMELVTQQKLSGNIDNLIKKRLSDNFNLKNDKNNIEFQTKVKRDIIKKLEVNKKITRLNGGVSKIDNKNKILELFKHIKNLKDQQLTKAFTKMFMVAAWIVTSFSFVGLFTDRNQK